jgi:hypothetical protein
MNIIKSVTIEPIWVYVIPKNLEQNKIYISEKKNTSSHLCLCGCNKVIVNPINFKHWEISENSQKQITLFPSILNNHLDCKSHYVITNNKANFI